MNSVKVIKSEIKTMPKTAIFSASHLYQIKFSSLDDKVFFKTIGKLVKENILTRLGKGIYARPRNSKFGFLKPNEELIILNYIKTPSSGMEVGYGLYSKLGLTTQTSKKRVFYVTKLNTTQLKVNNLFFIKKDFLFKEPFLKTIEILEVLQNFNKIEDLNISRFNELLLAFSNTYNEQNSEMVISKIKYKKSTIAFLKEILDFYNVKNSLSKQLSPFSKYEIPNWKKK